MDFMRSLWGAGIVPVASCLGLGRRRRALQHQCRSHGRGGGGIHSRRPADFPDGRGRRAGRRRRCCARSAATEIEDLIRQQQSFRRNDSEAGSRASARLPAALREVRIVGGAQPQALLSAANGETRAPGTRVLPVIRPRAMRRAAHGAAHEAMAKKKIAGGSRDSPAEDPSPMKPAT